MSSTEVHLEPAEPAELADEPVPGRATAAPRATPSTPSARRQVLGLGLLVGLAAVAGLSFTRILPASQLVGRVVVSAATATAVAELCRRLRPRRLVVSLGASVVAYVVVMGVLVFRADTLGGLPTPTSVHAVGDALVNGASRILTSAVPTPPVAAALLVPLTVAWLVAWTGATVADRTRDPLAPALPGVVGFAFGLLFGGDAPLVGLTAALVGLAAGLGVVRAMPSRPDGPRRRRTGVVLPLALVLVLALVAAAVAAALGPTSGQLDLHHRHPATLTFSPAITPLSQIQGQLLARPAVAEFQVTVPAADAALLPNWRLAVLDHFDGSVWSSPETYEPAGGTLPAAEGTDAPSTQVPERVVIQHLGGVWLPTAGPATTTSLDLVDVGTSSGSLALAGGVSQDLSYQVEATVAQISPAALASATPQGGGDDVALPDTAVSDLGVIRRYATAITRQATTPAAKLAALEAYLRTNRFTDTPESDSGQSYARVSDFLRKHHTGTAEQFATTFALLARSLGYPARVAVGFRRGTAVDGRFSVTSLDAYAWPEVHFAGLGWVPYDPTPDPSGAPAPAATPAPGTSPGPASGAGDQLAPKSAGSTPEITTGASHGSGLADLVVWGTVLVLLALVLVSPLAVVGLKRRRTRRRRRGRDPAARVAGAWLEAIDQVRAAQVRVDASLTNSEVVSTARVHLGPEVGESLGRLRTLVNRAGFAPAPVEAQQAADAWAAADEVRDRVQGRFPWFRRALMAVDPRPLAPSWIGS